MNKQIEAENEADDAAVEEAEAKDENGKAQGHKKLVASCMAAQAAKERAERGSRESMYSSSYEQQRDQGSKGSSGRV